MLEATGYHTNRHRLSEIQTGGDLVFFLTRQPQHTPTCQNEGEYSKFTLPHLKRFDCG